MMRTETGPGISSLRRLARCGVLSAAGKINTVWSDCGEAIFSCEAGTIFAPWLGESRSSCMAGVRSDAKLRSDQRGAPKYVMAEQTRKAGARQREGLTCE